MDINLQTQPSEKPKVNFSRIFSPSKIKQFDQCPKSYWFYFVDPIYYGMKKDLKKMPQNIFSFNTLGKAVHNAITLFYYLSEKERALQNLKNILEITWVSEVMWNKNFPLGQWGGFSNLDEENESRNWAILMLENFYNIQPKTKTLEFLPMKDFRHSFGDYETMITPINEDFDISGKFDLVLKNSDDTLDIIDFKTGKKENEDKFQMLFYKLLAEKKFKKPVRNLYYYFLRSGKILEVDHSQLDKEKIMEDILKKVDEIRKTVNYEAKPTSLCKYCLFKDFCPKKEEVRSLILGVRSDEVSDDLPF